MQKSTTHLVPASEAQQTKSSVPVLKTLKTLVVCVSIVLTGLYVEILGATLPDLRLQHKLYHQYGIIGILLAVASASSIIGASATALIYNSFNTKNSTNGIFGKTAKLDFLLSISFFLSTAGVLLIQFVSQNNLIILCTSFGCIGLAQGMSLIGASLSINELWNSSNVKLFTTRYRFSIFVLYAIGACSAPALVRLFLKPFIYSYRQSYQEPSKEFLQDFQLTSKSAVTSTITSTRTTSYKPLNPRLTFKPTYKTTTTQTRPAIEPNALSIDFLRLDTNEDGSDNLYRLFDQYFNYIFYLLTALNALMVIFYSVLFLIESKVFIRKASESAQVIEMGIPSKQQKQQPVVVIEKKSAITSLKATFSNFSIFISDNTKQDKTFKFSKFNFLNITISLLVLLFLTIFYSIVYASLKIQSNYLLSYSIQPEYVPRYYDEYFNEIFDFPAKPLTNTTSFYSVFSFSAPYNSLSLSLVKGTYLQMAFYSGIIAGISLNLVLISFTSLKSISLLYINTCFYLLIQIATFLFASTSIDKELSLSKPSLELTWFFLQFSSGFFLSPLPALLYDYLTVQMKSTSTQATFSFKTLYLTACELLGLSVGTAAFQWLIALLIESNKSFNSFINIQCLNSIANVILLILIHVCYLFVNKRKSTVNPQ